MPFWVAPNFAGVLLFRLERRSCECPMFCRMLFRLLKRCRASNRSICAVSAKEKATEWSSPWIALVGTEMEAGTSGLFLTEKEKEECGEKITETSPNSLLPYKIIGDHKQRADTYSVNCGSISQSPTSSSSSLSTAASFFSESGVPLLLLLPLLLISSPPKVLASPSTRGRWGDE